MKRIGFILGILISLALLVLLFFGIDIHRFFTTFRSANYYYTVLVILVVFAGSYLRALRWRWIMMPIKKISVGNLFSATVIGYMVNSLFPVRLGEFFRAHVIGRKEGISRASSFATIVVERLFDGLSILVILVLMLYWIKIPIQNVLIAAGWLALLFYSVVIVIILMFNYKRELVLRPFNFLPDSIKQKVMHILKSLAEGFKIVEEGHHLIIISLYSFSIWIVTAFGIYLTVIAFGHQISYAVSMFILVLLTFAVLIPSSPGFLGTFDAAMTYGLIAFGIPREAALSMAILFHGLSFLPIIILGFYYLWRDNISLSGKNRWVSK